MARDIRWRLAPTSATLPRDAETALPSTAAEPLTEAGAAERFARLHADAVRFDHRRNRWLMWTDHRWRPDADAAVMRLALTFVRAWQREAVEHPNRDHREAVMRFALRLERRDGLSNMLSLARTLKPIADAGDGWDKHQRLLCTTNGVVNLRTGTLRPGDPGDRITMSTTVAYDPTARCPRWERVIRDIFDSDADLIAYVQRALGYSLTGDTSEQCLFLLYGTGANGKGTFSNTLARVLGDYAWNMPFATIELRDRTAIPNDLAALVGRRFVTASETNDGTRLNESRVKALTGGDPITARFLHGEFFSFDPVAKFWLSVNHKPVVRDDSHGFWRRIQLIPFRRTFARDPQLDATLAQEAVGILAWCVAGCLRWQEVGLEPPPLVTDATREYATDSDPLGGFLEDACEQDPYAQVRASELFDHYRRWADGHGLGDRERLSSTMFGRKVSDRLRREKTRAGWVYFGVTRRQL